MKTLQSDSVGSFLFSEVNVSPLSETYSIREPRIASASI